MKRSQLLSTALCCFFACALSITPVAGEHFDSNPYSLHTLSEDNPQVNIQGKQTVLGSDASSAADWMSDEVWLFCSVVIALVGVAIMRKAMN